MSKTRMLLVLAVIVLLLPVVALGQGRTANLVGYEKADLVQGTVSVSEDGSAVVLTGVTSTYDKPLEIYLAKDFDHDGAIKVGELAADMPGDMTFELSGSNFENLDSVLIMVPGWDIPVAVGLLK
jgi:hypothetical protein